MQRSSSPTRGPSLDPPSEAVFLTLPQVCHLMQLSRAAVVKLIECGQLAAIKTGDGPHAHWRIGAASVHRLAGAHDPDAA